MATYTYERFGVNGRESIDVVAPMINPPPEWICFRDEDSGSWFESCPGERLSNPLLAWHRVYGVAVARVVDLTTKYKKSPISNVLPRRKGGKPDTLDGHAVKRHADGGYTDNHGRPILRTNADTRREMRRTGYSWD